MSIFVVATYDLTASGGAQGWLSRVLGAVEAECGEPAVAESRGPIPSGEQRGVTVVLAFASKAEAGRWADGRADVAPVRCAWLHPIGEAPTVDGALLRSLSRSPRRWSRR